MNQDQQLLVLLQLASPSLPLGAYSYSEGLETLVEQGKITNPEALFSWLKLELQNGNIRLETAVMLRAYQAFLDCDIKRLIFWNHWLTASKESRELRQQSWQMGNSLMKLLLNLNSHPNLMEIKEHLTIDCNYGIAFGIGAALWEIEPRWTVLGYLQSWVSNLVNTGIKLIPLGQTAGQGILYQLNNIIAEEAPKILALENHDLMSCSLGLGLASLQHETLYSRLFRS
jgi:urease accessory protein